MYMKLTRMKSYVKGVWRFRIVLSLCGKVYQKSIFEVAAVLKYNLFKTFKQVINMTEGNKYDIFGCQYRRFLTHK